MSENLETTAGIDELSRLLDAMNSGQQPESDDKETAELLAVAALIKNAGIPVRPPQHILDQTVEQAMAGLQSSKPGRLRAWLYSGALSAAAAVVLIVGLNLMPTLTEKVPPVPPPAVGSDLRSAPRELPAKQQSPIVAQTAPEEPEKPLETAEKIAPILERQTSPGKPAAQTGTASQFKEIEPAKPSDATKTPPAIVEKAPMMSESKAAYEASRVSPANPKNRPPVITALSLPGHVPDTIVTDTDRGTVRQIFNRGTLQEFIITQRLKVKEAAQSKSLAPAIAESEAKPGALNKVTVSIYNQEVTIEGRRTRQELMQLAHALTP